MDQVKKLLAKLVQLQFWIITSIAVLLGLGGYFLASSEYGKLYSAQKTALDKNFGDIKTVSAAIPTHPNSVSQQKMGEIIHALSEDVRIAWASQYERQAQFLQWPEAISNPLLVSKMKKYYPIEIKLTYPDDPRDVSKTELQTYAVYFDQQMPQLAQIIGVDWIGKANTSASGGMGGMMGGMDGMMGGMDSMMGGMDSMMGGMGSMMGGSGGSRGNEGGGSYGGDGGGGYPGMGGGMMGGMGMPGFSNKPPDLVTWRKPSQDELITDIRMWRGDTPTVYEVYYTQENMWILEGLLNIIHKTNGNAIANFQCAIKEIKFLRIGKTAVGKAGTIDIPGAMTAGMMGGMGSMGGMMGESGEMGGGESYGGGEMGEDMGGSMSGSGYGGEGGMEGMGGMGGVVVLDPANRRYVDANFEPVSGDDMRSKMQSAEPADAYFAVAKRVPVRMRFKIDQRKTQEFLANCGNADLMFEVNQVRLGDTSPAPIGGMGGSMMGGPGSSMTGGMGGMMGGMGGMMGGSGGSRGDEGGGGYGGGGSSGGGYGGGSYGGGGMMGESMGGMMGGSMGGMMGGSMGGMMGGGMMGMGGERDPWELDIEVYGVVYLFNPVDIKRLGLEKVTEQTELAVTVEPTEENPLPQPEAVKVPADVNVPGGAGGNPANGDPANGNPEVGLPSNGSAPSGTGAAGPVPGGSAPGGPGPVPQPAPTSN